MNNSFKLSALAAALCVALTGCGGSSSGSSSSGSANTGTPNSNNNNASLQAPTTYEFVASGSTESNVSYSGQIARHVLINDLNVEIASGLEALIASGELTSSSTKDDIIAILNTYYSGGTDELGANGIKLTTTPTTQQTSYSDISGGKKPRRQNRR